MLGSILASGLAVGAIYALIGVTYNTMFSTSRVMSFTAGQLGMLGGVFGSLFVLRLGMPMIVGLVLTLAACALVGLVTEIVAVRPVLKSLDQHLYVLSTLALASMIQNSTAILWSTEPQPFPRIFPVGGDELWDEKFWLPIAACAGTIIALELLYRHTLVGRAFVAIAEDNFVARALGLPERRLRMASYALAGVIGGLAGFAGGALCWRSSPTATSSTSTASFRSPSAAWATTAVLSSADSRSASSSRQPPSWSAASSPRSRCSRCSSSPCWLRPRDFSAHPRPGGSEMDLAPASTRAGRDDGAGIRRPAPPDARAADRCIRTLVPHSVRRQRLLAADRLPRRHLLGADCRTEPGGRLCRATGDRLGRLLTLGAYTTSVLVAGNVSPRCRRFSHSALLRSSVPRSG